MNEAYAHELLEERPESAIPATSQLLVEAAAARSGYAAEDDQKRPLRLSGIGQTAFEILVVPITHEVEIAHVLTRDSPGCECEVGFDE